MTRTQFALSALGFVALGALVSSGISKLLARFSASDLYIKVKPTRIGPVAKGPAQLVWESPTAAADKPEPFTVYVASGICKEPLDEDLRGPDGTYAINSKPSNLVTCTLKDPKQPHEITYYIGFNGNPPLVDTPLVAHTGSCGHCP